MRCGVLCDVVTTSDYTAPNGRMSSGKDLEVSSLALFELLTRNLPR